MDEWGDILLTFKVDKENNLAQHLVKVHECIDQINIRHESVCMKMCIYSLEGDA